MTSWLMNAKLPHTTSFIFKYSLPWTHLHIFHIQVWYVNDQTSCTPRFQVPTYNSPPNDFLKFCCQFNLGEITEQNAFYAWKMLENNVCIIDFFVLSDVSSITFVWWLKWVVSSHSKGEMGHFFCLQKNFYVIHGAFLQHLDHDSWVVHLSTSNLFVVMQIWILQH